MGLFLGIGIGIPFGGRPGTAVVRLAAPATLDVTEGFSTVDLDWSDVVGAASYEYNVGAGWVNTGLTSSATGVSVAYGAGVARVRAIDAGGVRGHQIVDSFYLAYPVPSAPQTVNVTPDSPDYLNFAATWTAPSSNAAYVVGYKVRLDADAFVDVGLVLSYASSSTAGSHTFEVVAYNIDEVESAAGSSGSFELTEEPVDPGEGFYGAGGDLFYVGSAGSPFYN